jgi:hypothetical protein
MSYKVKPSSVGPFALLTLSTNGTMAQWDQSTEAWVTASNTWSGDAMLFGVPAVVTSGTSAAIGAIGFDISGSNYEEFSQQFNSTGAARSKSDDQMVAYGSDASFYLRSATPSFTIDSARARCAVIRVVL